MTAEELCRYQLDASSSNSWFTHTVQCGSDYCRVQLLSVYSLKIYLTDGATALVRTYRHNCHIVCTNVLGHNLFVQNKHCFYMKWMKFCLINLPINLWYQLIYCCEFNFVKYWHKNFHCSSLGNDALTLTSSGFSEPLSLGVFNEHRICSPKSPWTLHVIVHTNKNSAIIRHFTQ
jgi:hypothetical protein